jgi:hypothetical protein
MKRLSAGETNDSLGTDLYSAFFTTVETNNQERKAHITQDTKSSGQEPCSTAPMSVPAITSRKEITFAFPWLSSGFVNECQSLCLFSPVLTPSEIECCPISSRDPIFPEPTPS